MTEITATYVQLCRNSGNIFLVYLKSILPISEKNYRYKKRKLHLDVTHFVNLFISLGVTNSQLFLFALIW